MVDPTVVTGKEEFIQTAASVEEKTRVPVELRTTVADPFSAYQRLRYREGGAFLETTGGQSGWGYFGVDPMYWLTVYPDGTVVDDETSSGGIAGFDGATDSHTLTALQSTLEEEQLARGSCTVPYPCGAIGWLSYDVIREIEDLPDKTTDDRQLPHAQLAFYDTLVAWEEPQSDPVTLHVTVCPEITDTGSLEQIYSQAVDRGAHLIEQIHSETMNVPAGQPAVENTSQITFQSNCGKTAFAERVHDAQQYIRDGDTFQANISQRLQAPAAVPPVSVYDALRQVNPAPYSALLEFPAADLVSASPELLLEYDQPQIRTEPIAGTRPRGDTQTEDERLEEDLLTDEKERAEHAMLVDLERNDLGKVSKYGSVNVTEYGRIDRYSEVMHLVSLVEGELQSDATLADAIAAMFPGGTITGAPKPRTMEIIDELETTRRGPYTGSVGIFGFDNRAILNIIIRTLVRHADAYHLRVGAGIVHDSVPDQEFDETLDKARALINAVDEALGDQLQMTVEEESDHV